jgi:hypothetical protein
MIVKKQNMNEPDGSRIESILNSGGKKLGLAHRKGNTINPTKAIYCIGDTDKVLRYDILSDRWSVL